MTGVRFSTGMPVSSAELIVPSFACKVFTVGRRSLESVVQSARNGRCTAKLVAPVANVDGDLSIVSCRQVAQAEIAAKVLAILPKRFACTFATGATSPAAWPMFLKKFSMCVFGFDSVCMTGVRCRKNGLNAAIAWLIDWPRPARASPKPLSDERALLRVGL